MNTFVNLSIIALFGAVNAKMAATSNASYEAAKHIVVVTGSNVTFSCALNTSSKITWSCQCEQGTLNIFNGLKMNPSLRHRMSVSFNNDTGECVLMIMSVSVNDSGEYSCSTTQYSKYTSTTQLIVLGHPQCHVNVSIPLNELELFQVSCSVAYAGRLHPVFNCQSESPAATVHINVTHISDTTSDEAIHVTTFVAVPSLDGNRIICMIHFNNIKLLTDEYVENNLAYNFTWTSPVINVTYGLKTTTVEPTNTTWFKHGDVLTCMADGNPSPTYQWIDWATDHVISESSRLVIDQCQLALPVHYLGCVASNPVSINYTNLTIVMNNITKSHCDSSSKAPHNVIRLLEFLVVASGVVVALLFVVCLAIVICLMVKRLKKFTIHVHKRQRTSDNVNGSSTTQSFELTMMTIVPEPDCGLEYNQPDLYATSTNIQNCDELSEPEYAELKMLGSKRKQRKSQQRQTAESPYADIDHTRASYHRRSVQSSARRTISLTFNK